MKLSKIERAVSPEAAQATGGGEILLLAERLARHGKFEGEHRACGEERLESARKLGANASRAVRPHVRDRGDAREFAREEFLETAARKDDDVCGAAGRSRRVDSSPTFARRGALNHEHRAPGDATELRIVGARRFAK